MFRILFWVRDLPEDVDEEFECWRRKGKLMFVDDELACVQCIDNEIIDEEW